MGQLGQRVGLVHELGQLGGAEELLHHRRHGLGVDQVVRHQVGDVRDRHPLLHRALHARQADPELVFQQLADRPHAPVAQVVDVVREPAAEFDLEQAPHHVHDVLAPERLDVEVGVDLELLVDHEPPDLGEIVAAGIHEHAPEERTGRVHRGRIAWAEPAVDLHQRLVGIREVVLLQGLGDRQIGLAGHEHEQLERRHLPGGHLGRRVPRDDVVALDDDLARLRVDDAAHRAPAHEGFGLDLDPIDAALQQPLDEPGRQGLTRADDHVLLARKPEVLRHPRSAMSLRRQLGPQHRRLDPHPLDTRVTQSLDELRGQLRARRGQRFLLSRQSRVLREPLPVQAGRQILGRHGVLEPQRLRLVEVLQDLLAGEDLALLEEPEGAEKRRRQHLAAPVHAHPEDLVGVELELDPGAAVGNHPRGVQQLARRDRLALVVVEEDAGRALQLRHHDAFGAVDDEGALLRHQRQLAEIDFLLADLADGLGLGLLVVVDDLEAKRDLERNGVGHSAVVTLLYRVLRIPEVVAVKLECRVAVVVGDGEYGPEDGLQPDLLPPLGQDVLLEKLLVRLLLDLDEVRDLDDRRDLAEVLPDPPPARDSACHTSSAPRPMGLSPAHPAGTRLEPADRSPERRVECDRESLRRLPGLTSAAWAEVTSLPR